MFVGTLRVHCPCILWFHLYRLTVYFMFYWFCLRHPDDGSKYDRNMLVINSLLFLPTNAHIYIKILNYIKKAFVCFWRENPPVGHGLLIHEVSRSYKTTHHSR